MIKKKIATLLMACALTMSLSLPVFAFHNEAPESHRAYLLENPRGVWAETYWYNAWHYTRCQIKDSSTIYADTGRVWDFSYTRTGAIYSNYGTRYSYYGHDHALSR